MNFVNGIKSTIKKFNSQKADPIFSNFFNRKAPNKGINVIMKKL